MDRMTAKIDKKGRITLPREIKQALGAEEGDIVFLTPEKDHRIRITKAVEDPIALLAEHADQEYAAGRTRDLREMAKEI